MRTEILKNITTKIGSGATPRGGERAYKSEGISLIRSQNVLDFTFSRDGLAYIDDIQANALDNVTVEENDILLNITGDSIARCCIVPKEVLPARVNQHVSIVRCDSTVNSNYVFYFLEYLKPYLLKICGVGGTRNALTKEVIEQLQITLPENQEKIAEILKALDDKISLNTRINAEIEQLARTIYNYWFVQFDFPISATQAATMGNPALEGKPYRSSGGEMVWNEELKRMVPKGWKVMRFEDVAKIKAGGDRPEAFSTDKTEHCPIPIFSNGIENEGLYGFTDKATVLEQSITISARGTIGYSVLRNSPFVPIIRLIVIIPKISNAAKYFHEWLSALEYGRVGSVQQQLTVPEISSWPILVPTREILEKFDIITSAYISKSELIKKENQEHTRLRDFLLPLLMSGEVTVKC